MTTSMLTAFRSATGVADVDARNAIKEIQTYIRMLQAQLDAVASQPVSPPLSLPFIKGIFQAAGGDAQIVGDTLIVGWGQEPQLGGEYVAGTLKIGSNRTTKIVTLSTGGSVVYMGYGRMA